MALNVVENGSILALLSDLIDVSSESGLRFCEIVVEYRFNGVSYK